MQHEQLKSLRIWSAVSESKYILNIFVIIFFLIFAELCFRTQLLSFSDALSKLCSTHIAEKVKINWLLTGTDIQGVASLRGIFLSHAMVDLTTVSPLHWGR